MKSILLLLGLVSFTCASVVVLNQERPRPKRCCVPGTFQVTISGAAFHDIENGTEGFKKVFVNFGTVARKGLAAMRIFDAETYKPKKRIVIDYKDQVIYVIGANNTCETKEAKMPPPHRCLPKSAKYVGEFRMGGGWDTLHVKTFVYSNATMDFVENISFTRNCVPIGAQMSINGTRGQVFATVGYVNAGPRITDRGLFYIPDSCKNQTEEALPLEEEHLYVPKFMLMGLE